MTSAKVRPIAITSPTLFISLPILVDGPQNLPRSQRRELAIPVVQRRLEDGRGAARDAVGNVGQRIAERKLAATYARG